MCIILQTLHFRLLSYAFELLLCRSCVSDLCVCERLEYVSDLFISYCSSVAFNFVVLALHHCLLWSILFSMKLLNPTLLLWQSSLRWQQLFRTLLGNTTNYHVYVSAPKCLSDTVTAAHEFDLHHFYFCFIIVWHLCRVSDQPISGVCSTFSPLLIPQMSRHSLKSIPVPSSCLSSQWPRARWKEFIWSWFNWLIVSLDVVRGGRFWAIKVNLKEKPLNFKPIVKSLNGRAWSWCWS